MEYRSMSVPALTIGFDLGDKTGHLFALAYDGEVLADECIATDRDAIVERFSDFPTSRVVIEAGTQSQWVAELLDALGHEVVVANPCALGDKKTRRKNDRNDAMGLARKGRADPDELRPIQHRSSEAQYDVCILRARCCLVRTRTRLVNAVRSLVKVVGERLVKSSTPAFVKMARPLIPESIKPAVEPLLHIIEETSKQIAAFDKQVEEFAQKKYPETKFMTQVTGVGALSAVAFVLTLEDPRRFEKSRSVGAFVGLVPGLCDSGDNEPQLKISKAGDSYLRTLLVGSAQYILGCFGPDCDLRRYGERILAKGAKNAKRRAVIAVARKLANLLRLLWIRRVKYDPFYNARRKGEVA